MQVDGALMVRDAFGAENIRGESVGRFIFAILKFLNHGHFVLSFIGLFTKTKVHFFKTD